MQVLRTVVSALLVISALVSSAYARSPGDRSSLPPGYPSRSATLDALPGFVTPPPGYGDVGFYWWLGDTLTRERLTWQMDQLKDRGVTGLQVNYAHSDSGGLIWGLTYPSKPRLFSDEWWNLFRWFLSEAHKRGMSVSLSDYTLGHAGQGWFTDSMLTRVPDLAGSTLVADTLLCRAGKPVAMPVGPGLLVAKAYKVVDYVGQARLSVELRSRIKNDTLRWTPPSGSWTIVLVRRQLVPASIDPMHPLSGRELIATFFQPFEDHCPGEAGRGLNFFFSDELDFGIRGYLWDRGFAGEFQRRKKYPVLAELPALFIDIGPGTPKIRMDYNDVMVALSEEHFFKPVYDWHTSRGMVFGCDHGGRGRDVTEFGDYFRTQRWMSGPGCDQPMLARDIVKAKVASSIAHLYDRPRAWLEGFHSSAWGTSSGQVADAIFANFALGHNLLSFHGLYYSTHGSWWEWAPPDNHWRQPYWDQMTRLMKCSERLSYLLSQGRHVCDIALVYPVAPVEAGIRAEASVSTAFAAADSMYRGGWDFDFIDFTSLASSHVEGRMLNVTGEHYKVLVLPNLGAVRSSTMEKALEFYRGGGTVVAIGGLPMASDRMGRNDPKLEAINQEIFGRRSSDPVAGAGQHDNSKGGAGILVPDPAAAVKFLHGALTPDVRVPAGSSQVYMLHRRVGPRDVYFIYGGRQGGECVLRATGKAELWNPWDGSTKALPVLSQSPTETRLRLPLEESDPQLIVMSPGVAVREAAPAPNVISLDSLLLDSTWEFEVKPTLDNRWGDFRLPAFEGKIGPESWRVRHAPGGSVDSTWTSPHFDDSRWSLSTVSYGPRMYRLGPLPASSDSAAVDDMLSHLDAVDPAVPVTIGGKPYSWRPVEFSWRWGLQGDPGHQGYHGLKGLVHDDLIELGTPHRDWPGVPTARLVADSAGQRYYFWSTVSTANACRALVEQGGFLPSALWLDHDRLAAKTGSVELKSGWTSVLLRYDGLGRGFVVFRSANTKNRPAGQIPLAARWYGDPSLLQYDISPRAANRTERFRLLAPPGLTRLTFAAKGVPKVWIDGSPVRVVAQPPDALRFPDTSVTLWRCELSQPVREQATVALAVDEEPGVSGGGVFPEPITFECSRGLIALGDLATNEPLRTYSGGMIYRTTIRLPSTPKAPGSVVLDLGLVVSSAEVRVNGTSAGVHPAPPWKFDITRLVRDGDNSVEVEVYNTLGNNYLTTPTPYVGPTTSGLIGPVRVLYAR